MIQHLRGVVFRITVRGGHASVAIIVTGDGGDGDCKAGDGSPSDGAPTESTERMVLVIVRIGGPEWDAESECGKGKDALTEMRSNIRRLCKLGNEVEFRGCFDEPTEGDAANRGGPSQPSTDWTTWERFIVDYYLPKSTETCQGNVRVWQELKWDAAQCQARRDMFFPSRPRKQQEQQKKSKQQPAGNDEKQSSSRLHGGGIGKRKQGEIVADFLLWMLSTMYCDVETDDNDAASGKEGAEGNQTPPHNQLPSAKEHLFMERWVPLHSSLTSPREPSVTARNASVARKIAQSQTDVQRDENATSPNTSLGGIIDAAGGAGHVSLALALRGVHSTVVDPRSTVGRLPGRDRKALKKSKQPHFATHRAWFGARPKGVDRFFREGTSNGSTDPATLPICSMCSEDRLLPNCVAIVALHPDEATGSIVVTAVANEIPFVVVPCCVFSRLFSERIKPNGAIVSTYYDLIDWLVAKHPAIRVTGLPFEGANIAVWATFQ